MLGNKSWSQSLMDCAGGYGLRDAGVDDDDESSTDGIDDPSAAADGKEPL